MFEGGASKIDGLPIKLEGRHTGATCSDANLLRNGNINRMKI
jgi:hypothetical protein